jgi:hypothetical protein
MRSGGSAQKGGRWEREQRVAFSQWISRSEHRDLFERNVSSGGAFTTAARRGTTRGVPGDLMAVHPLSLRFQESFFVEAKSWEDLKIDRAMWNPKEKLCKVIHEQELLARRVRRIFLLVAKQNFRTPILIMARDAGLVTFGAVIDGLQYHSLWCDSIFVCRLDHAFGADPDEVMTRAERWLRPLGDGGETRVILRRSRNE